MSLTQEIIRQQRPTAAKVANYIKQKFGILGKKGSVFLNSSGLIIIQIPFDKTVPSKDLWRKGGQVNMSILNDTDIKIKDWDLISFMIKDQRKFGTEGYVEITIDIKDNEY
ncbi:MAG: hypothetical protein JHC26_00340 [Thermofilum sp.]|jgi:hypothetical protein|uniref:hypothetical protein n=1 Tax=Thermofilum sp. TaxID=1961369 RepID=UPI00258F82D8|nr:hypothetical protein [Thermofilum sp.]MCI4407513.1 hypothetical protein [Thermofilum sp.]